MKRSFLSLSSLVLAFAAGVLVFPTASARAQTTQTFSNPNPITINDATGNPSVPSNATPYPSTITVSGMTGTITSTPGSVKVTLHGFSHTFPDDVAILLVGPTGAAFIIQNGVTSDFSTNPSGNPASNVTYTISDSGATQLPNDGPITAGTFKPADYYGGDNFPAPGPGTNYASPSPVGSSTFTSVFGGTNPNGTWSLFIRDFVTGDAGTISGGWTLEITTTGGGGGQPNDAPVDMNGDGRTDYVVVRTPDQSPSSQATWWTLLNGPGTFSTFNFGVRSDFFVPADYDGDLKDDHAVWRAGPAGEAGFYLFLSMGSVYTFIPFGQTGDDPDVVGDYDGDGKDDLAVYRAGATAGAQSVWHIFTRAGGYFTRNWGIGPNDFAVTGDYDGDGKNDFVIQRDEGNGTARFWILYATGAIENFIFGTPSDVIVPGDFDGDGKYDIAVIQLQQDNSYLWVYRSSANANSLVSVTWGLIDNGVEDVPVPGDYNGDRRTDFAIWRQNTGTFWIFAPGANPSLFTRQWGQLGDYPPANFPVQ